MTWVDALKYRETFYALLIPLMSEYVQKNLPRDEFVAQVEAAKEAKAEFDRLCRAELTKMDQMLDEARQ